MLRDVSDLRWHGRHRSDCHLVRFSATPLTDRLRALWDFDDLGASEQRFQAQLERETTDPGRAEVLTQLARVQGLRGDFERCVQLLDKA